MLVRLRAFHHSRIVSASEVSIPAPWLPSLSAGTRRALQKVEASLELVVALQAAHFLSGGSSQGYLLSRRGAAVLTP